MKLQPGAKRAAIFVYFDPDGMVDSYIPVWVSAVRRHCSFLLCVVNGTLKEAGQKALEACSDRVVYRPNEGLDVTGYKEGYQLLRDEGVLCEADELLFFNQTVFGPVFPLGETFDAMDGQDVDFWGMTRHRGMDVDPWGTIPYGYMPPHIQSYFFAVRKPMFSAAEFDRYWNELPPIHSYLEAVGIHEVCFTKHFADLGFRWDVYVHTEQLEPYNDYPLMGMPAEVLRKTRCPVVKRKSFLTGRTAMNAVPQGGAAAELWRFLRDNTSYDTRLISENLTRTAPVADYTEVLGLFCPPMQTPRQPHSLTGVFWLQDTQLAEATIRAAQKMAPAQQVFLCANAQAQAALLKGLPGADCRLTDREPLEAFSEMLNEVSSEYVCFLPTVTPPADDGLRDLNVFLNAALALCETPPLFAAMEQDASLGLIAPAPVSHLSFVSQGVRWNEQYAAVLGQLKAAGIEHIPLLAKKAPLRLFGGAFFARTGAVRRLAQMNFEPQRDLLFDPQDPAAEYLPALCCQAEGLLCAFAAPYEAVCQLLFNRKAQQDELVSLLATPNKCRADQLRFRLSGILQFYYERRHSMTLEQAYAAKLSAKEKLWIILRLLLSEKSFSRLYKLCHGGRPLAEPDYPPDLLD